MFFTYLLFPLGFIFLIKGASLLIDGASSIAKRLGVSPLIIGLTVVAIGTSVPEFIVNIFASVRGSTDIAIGNILGSNITNILLILGISAVISPLAVKRSAVWKEILMALFAVIVVALMASTSFISGDVISQLTRLDGLILIALFIVFLYYVFGISRTKMANIIQSPVSSSSFFGSILMIIMGLTGLILGGKWIIDAAIALAIEIDISQSLIGLTIIAIGTSLPELATSAVAVYKGNADIAVGNIVGSNIFNILGILGISAAINPLLFSSASMRDVAMTIIATFLLFIFMFTGRRYMIERWQGVCLVVLYVVYITFLIAQEIAK